MKLVILREGESSFDVMLSRFDIMMLFVLGILSSASKLGMIETQSSVRLGSMSEMLEPR